MTEDTTAKSLPIERKRKRRKIKNCVDYRNNTLSEHTEKKEKEKDRKDSNTMNCRR
jgi:hypothetical protein